MLGAAGRGEDYRELSLHGEWTWDPLNEPEIDSYSLAFSIGSLLNQLFGKSREPFWHQAYTTLVRAAIELHRLEERPWFTPKDVYRRKIAGEGGSAEIEAVLGRCPHRTCGRSRWSGAGQIGRKFADLSESERMLASAHPSAAISAEYTFCTPLSPPSARGVATGETRSRRLNSDRTKSPGLTPRVRRTLPRMLHCGAASGRRAVRGLASPATSTGSRPGGPPARHGIARPRRRWEEQLQASRLLPSARPRTRREGCGPSWPASEDVR